MTSTRVSGHTLMDEGRVYRHHERTTIGPAVCSCGERSETLITDAARKKWHRNHKFIVLRREGRGA